MKHKRWIWFAVCMIVIGYVLGAGGTATAATPQYGVYVQDDANLLSSSAKQQLYANAVRLKELTGTAQVGVVTVPSLNDRILEEVAVERFREMGLGDKTKNDGILLLYTAAENHVRIEVGYGLEGRVTDGKAGAMLDQLFLPAMQAGDTDRAFIDTQEALIAETAAEYNIPVEQVLSGYVPADYGSEEGFLEGVPGYMKLLLAVVIIVLIILDFIFTGGVVTFAILNMLSRRGGGSGGGGGGRGGGGSSGGGGASR